MVHIRVVIIRNLFGCRKCVALDSSEIQQTIFRLSEQLRKAINQSDEDEAFEAFDVVKQVLPEAEGFAAQVILVLELVQYLVDMGVDEHLSRINPDINNLIDDCLVLGRSDELFTEMMTTFIGLDERQISTLILDLIDVAIDAAVFSGNAPTAESIELWWQEFQLLASLRDTTEAIQLFRTGSYETGTENIQTLTLQIETVLDALTEVDVLIDALRSSQPALDEIVSTYRRRTGLNRRMELKSLITEMDNESLNDAVIMLTIVLEGKLAQEVDSFGWFDNDRDLEQEDLDDEVESFEDVLSFDDDFDKTEATLKGGLVVRWDDERACWVGDDGSEWMVDETAPDVWMQIEMWRMMFPGKPQGYVKPQPTPERSEIPDRFLTQRLDWIDDDLRNRVLKLYKKNKYDRADSIQFDHFKRTGRWLLGNPPTKGWYPDPLRRFDLRFWNGRYWTELVSNRGDDPIVDPDFPTDEDMK